MCPRSTFLPVYRNEHLNSIEFYFVQVLSFTFFILGLLGSGWVLRWWDVSSEGGAMNFWRIFFKSFLWLERVSS